MRRSICTVDPHVATAGEVATWKFAYTLAQPLPKGALLTFDMHSEGRMFDWELPSTSLSQGKNVIYLRLPQGGVLEMREIAHPQHVYYYQCTLPNKIEAGETLTIIVGGGPKSRDPIRDGNRCQKTTARRRPFYLYLDANGSGKLEDPELFTLDVKGGPLTNIVTHLPSCTAKNKRFDIAVRFEDQYANLTANAPENTLIKLTYENFRENLQWKLFVPETGYIFLPNLYFNEAGIYRIQLTNLTTGEHYFSWPIKCFPEQHPNLLWGQLHGEFCKFDASIQIEYCLRHVRDEHAFNFFASSPYENAIETPNELWKHIASSIEELDEDDRFATFLGFQYPGDPGTEGLRQFMFSSFNKVLFRKKDAKTTSLKKIYKTLTPKEIIAIPECTMLQGVGYHFENFQPQLERLVEIYNAWGSSEMTEQEGNRFPFRGYLSEDPQGSIIRALNQNCRFGFVAGGYDDRGPFSHLYANNQHQYTPGLTAIISPSFHHADVFEALYERHCYATTGVRMILGFYLAGVTMGTELSTATKPGLKINRHISGYVAGTTDLRHIEIVRNGEVIHTIYPEGYYCDYYFDDMAPLAEVVLPGPPPFCYYYIRVLQKDGHQGWSSPIWVDFVQRP